VDKLTPKERSENMRRIRSVDMGPEMRVRRLVHALGYRFRLHGKSLPGKPDLVFASRRKVILVHGCFWHHHDADRCLDSRLPRSNRSYWIPKLMANVARDRANLQRLRSMGWDVLVIWDCQTHDAAALSARVTEFLGPARARHSGGSPPAAACSA